MSSRELILGRIRDAHTAAPPADVEKTRTSRTGTLDPAGVTDLFAARVDDYHATVIRTDPAGLDATIRRLLRDADATTVVVPGGLLTAWREAGRLATSGSWHDAVRLVEDDGDTDAAALDRIDAVVTGATVGIAETGTLVLDGSPDQGRRAITLVPDHHLCVVWAEQLVQTVPEAIARLDPTRPLTWISGPSATSDIELDRVEGVHGPRTLDVIIVDS
jgi:L-lactate dehydrogenase complex protein LldG